MTILPRLLLSLTLGAALSGCAVVSESARNAAEESAAVPAGSRVAGAGFSVRSPAPGLGVVRDQPRRGFLSLRSPSRDLFLGGAGTYNVYPFTLEPPPPTTLREAWASHARSQFSAGGRSAYRILVERTGTWRGEPAYFQSAYGQQAPDGGGFVIASCLVRRGAGYFWIVRSVSVLDGRPETLSRARRRAEQELPAFLDSVTFDAPRA